MNILQAAQTFFKNLADKPTKDSPDLGEIGYGRESVLGDFNKEEKSTDTIAIADYIKMGENDGEVQSLIRAITTPIISAGWEIIEPEEGAKEEADFIKENFGNPPHMNGLSTPMNLIISDMTRAFVEGFRLYEKVWQVVDGKIYLRKLAPRDTQTVKLKADVQGGFDGAVQKITIGTEFKEVTIPQYKCLLYTFQKEKDWLYGRSILKAAYYHYDKKHKLYYIAHKSAELQAIPAKILYFTANMTDQQKKKAEQAVDRMGVNTRVSLPKDIITLEPFSGDGKQNLSVKDMIDHHNNQMSKSLLAQFIDLSAEKGQAGSYALSQTHADLFTQSIEAEMRNMASHINNYVIPQLIDWNFGSKKYPLFEFNPLNDEAKALLLTTFTEIIKNGTLNTYLPEAFVTGVIEKVADKANIEVEEGGLLIKDGEVAKLKEENSRMAKEKFQNPQLDKDGKPIKEPSETPPNKEKEEKPTKPPEKKLADIQRWKRQLSLAEQKVDLEGIADEMDKMEMRLKTLAQELYYTEKQIILDQIRDAITQKNTALLDKISTQIEKKYARYLYTQANSLLDFAKAKASGEFGVATPATNSEVTSILKQMANDISQKETAELIWIAKKNAMTAITDPTKTAGSVIDLTQNEMDSKFNYNINVTAPILSTTSVNMGRDVVFKANEDKLYGYEYSAILDESTCDECASLDGKVIDKTDSDYYTYMPPLHPNCRCIWVAIMDTEEDLPQITGIEDNSLYATPAFADNIKTFVKNLIDRKK